MKVPVLGILENMSFFVCGECGTRHHLFGQEGGRQLAMAAKVPFLGEIPVEPEVREGGDEGTPVVLRVNSPAGQALQMIAEDVWNRLDPVATEDVPPNRI